MTHDYFNGGQFIRSAVYDLPRLSHPLRYVPWCLGVYREHLRYVPFSLSTFRHQAWYTLRNDSVDPTEREASNLRLLWNNFWDDATLSASSEQARFPASNTQHHWLSRCWRSAHKDIFNVYLKADFGEAKAVRALVIANHWFNPGTEVRVQANNADAWGAPAVDVSLEITDDKTYIEHFWSNNQSYRYWRIWMTADMISGSLTGEEDINTRGDRDLVPYCQPHFKIGRIFLGDYYEMSQNFIQRKPDYDEDNQEFRGDRKGALSEILNWKYRNIYYVFDRLGASDYEALWDIYEVMGKGKPFFIIENYRYWWKRTFYVTFDESLDYEIQYNRADTTLQFKETR